MVTTRSGRNTTSNCFVTADEAATHMAKGMSHDARKEFAAFLNQHIFKHRNGHISVFSFRGASITVVDSLDVKHYMPVYHSLPAIAHKAPDTSRWSEFEENLRKLCPMLVEVVKD